MGDGLAHIYAQLDKLWGHLEEFEKTTKDKFSEISSKYYFLDKKMTSILSMLESIGIGEKETSTLNQVFHLLDELRKRIQRIEEDYINTKDIEDLNTQFKAEIQNLSHKIEIIRNNLEMNLQKRIDNQLKTIENTIKSEREDIENKKKELMDIDKKLKDFIKQIQNFIVHLINEVGRIDELEKEVKELKSKLEEKDKENLELKNTIQKLKKDFNLIKLTVVDTLQKEISAELVKDELDEKLKEVDKDGD